MTIGEGLKRFREKFRLNQKEVAEIAKISVVAYQKYEYEKSAPTVPVLIRIAQHFNVTLDYLAGLSDNPNPGKKTFTEVDDDDSNALMAAAESDRILDYHENLAHVLAKQGIKI